MSEAEIDGFLIERKDSEELAKKLLFLFKNRDIQRRMAKESIEFK